MASDLGGFDEVEHTMASDLGGFDEVEHTHTLGVSMILCRFGGAREVSESSDVAVYIGKLQGIGWGGRGSDWKDHPRS
jgi:hypothetical protein